MRFRLLRAFVAAALLANLVYAAWHAGLFGFLGLRPATQRDPARLEKQVRPQGLRVLSPAAAASAVAAAASAAAVGPLPPKPAAAAAATAVTAEPLADVASAPASAPGTAAPAAAGSLALACLDLGPLDSATAADSAERALATVLPERAWAREQRPVTAQYAVYVGPILSRDAARQRREELVKLKLSFEAIELPDGRFGGKQGGYSLGRHDSEPAAQAALDSFVERGLRNARVVLVREAGAPRTWLRMDRLTAQQAEAVRALPATALGGLRAGECLLGSAMSVGPPR